MNHLENGLNGVQFRHASRKPRHRFDRNWSILQEVALANEEHLERPIPSCPRGNAPERSESEEGLPLECSWWLLIAGGAGRKHFGGPSTVPVGPHGEAQGEAIPRSDTFEDLHQLLTHGRQQTRLRACTHDHESALTALGRHPFFLDLPSIGFETPAALILEMIVEHHALWLRSVADWSAPEGAIDTCLADLFAHLFYLYEMPAWLDFRTAPNRAANRESDLLALAVYLGRGGSLYRAAEYLFIDAKGSPLFTRRGVHHLREVPAYQTIQEALFHAYVLQSGGDDYAVSDFLYYGFRPNLMHGAPVVRAVAPWLAKHRSSVAPTLGILIVAWGFADADRRRVKARLKGGSAQPLSLKGRSARSVLTEVFTSLSTPKHPLRYRMAHLLKWPSHGWERALNSAGTNWAFRELCELHELALESKEMDHCVFKFLGQCASGETLVFSLVSDRGNRVTLQVCPTTKALLEIRGRGNREPYPAELAAAQEWLQTIQNGWRNPEHDQPSEVSPLALLHLQ